MPAHGDPRGRAVHRGLQMSGRRCRTEACPARGWSKRHEDPSWATGLTWGAIALQAWKRPEKSVRPLGPSPKGEDRRGPIQPPCAQGKEEGAAGRLPRAGPRCRRPRLAAAVAPHELRARTGRPSAARRAAKAKRLRRKGEGR